jgi:hypothetical protein
MMAVLSSVAAIAALFLLVDGRPGYAAAAAVLLLLMLGLGAIDTMLARRQVDRHGGDVRAALEDADAPEPVIPVNRETPYGETPESHDDLSPRDVLPGEPMRKQLEQRRAKPARQGPARPGA